MGRKGYFVGLRAENGKSPRKIEMQSPSIRRHFCRLESGEEEGKEDDENRIITI